MVRYWRYFFLVTLYGPLSPVSPFVPAPVRLVGETPGMVSVFANYREVVFLLWSRDS